MLDVILVDDEEPALLEMEFLLRQYSEIHIAGSYTNSLEAMEKLALLKPDAIFIDIDMPQLNGIEFVKQLQYGNRNVNVIFVTAYEKYAVEAFRVEAMDYLLKPVIKEHLDQTVSRLISRKGNYHLAEEKLLEVRAMGQLQIRWTGSQVMKWRTEKEKELFAFLLNNRGRVVTRDRILNELWGEYQADRAVRQLHNAIYYLKKTLLDYGIKQEHIHITGHYSLQLGKVWYDRDYIESKMAGLTQLQGIEELERLLEVFAGGYHQYEGWSWVEQEREILRQSELKVHILLSKEYQEAGLGNKAELLLKRAFVNNPLEELISIRLMELYISTGEFAKAMKHYMEYQHLLREELGIPPQKNIRKLYESIVNSET